MGGEKRGYSPMDLKLPTGTSPVAVELRHTGFQPWREKIVPDQNQKLRLTLVANVRSSSGGSTNVTAGSSTPAPYHKFQ